MSSRGSIVITWTFVLAVVAFLVSIWLMVKGAEKFTSGSLRTSVAFGVPAFTLRYLLSGIDLENLAVGIAAVVQGAPGISMGTIIGAAICMLTFAVGPFYSRRGVSAFLMAGVRHTDTSTSTEDASPWRAIT